MIAIFSLLLFIGLGIGVFSFWSPSQANVPSGDTRKASNELNELLTKVPSKSALPSLDSEKKWYGVTLWGYQDVYVFSTSLPLDKVAFGIQRFFLNRKTRIMSEEKHQLLFSRGNPIYYYCLGLDTLAVQEIEVSFQANGDNSDITRVSIKYRVSGFHVRLPPNQLRKEVFKLQKELITA